MKGYEDAINRCSTPYAPWHIIPAESKKFARVAVLETTLDRIEDGMRKRGFEPLSDKDLAAA